jgi:hypothetical protein
MRAITEIVEDLGLLLHTLLFIGFVVLALVSPFCMLWPPQSRKAPAGLDFAKRHPEVLGLAALLLLCLLVYLGQGISQR